MLKVLLELELYRLTNFLRDNGDKRRRFVGNNTSRNPSKLEYVRGVSDAY